MKTNLLSLFPPRLGLIGALLLLMCMPTRADVVGRVRDLFNGPHIAKRYAELKEDFYPTSLAWSPDGKYIASTGTHTRTINIWDVDQRKVVQTMELPVPPSPSYNGMSWSPDGRYLVVCAGDGINLTVRIWNTLTWGVAKDLNKAEGAQYCTSSVFTPDGSKLVLGKGDGVSVYSTQNWQLEKKWTLANDPGTAASTHVALSPDGLTIAIGVNGYWAHKPESHVALLDFARDSPVKDDFVAYTGVNSQINNLVFSPDGQQLATSSSTGWANNPLSVRFWRIADKKMLGAPLDGVGTGQVHSMAYTPDGKYFISGHADDKGTVNIVSPNTLQVIDTVHASQNAHSVIVKPDSSRFAVAAGQSIVIWSL
jgi:WD40 repeat protein